MNTKIDYIIVGQGLAGSAIAWELMQRGKSIVVFDEGVKNRASAYAAGLFNPIAGRPMTKAWKAETVFPFLEEFYSLAEKRLNKKFLYLLPTYRPFISNEEKEQWKQKSENSEFKNFLLAFHGPGKPSDIIQNPFGGIEITRSGYLDVVTWMSALKNYLIERDVYVNDAFQESELLLANDQVQYGELTASKIIFCNGLSALQSRWFDWLPFKP